MIGRARRQLPSWMVRPAAVDQATCSEIKVENEENVTEHRDAKASRPRKIVQNNQQNTGVPLPEKKSHSLKKCEARSSKRKTTMEDEEGQSNSKDDSDPANKVSRKTRKKFQQRDEPLVLKKCETSRRKRSSNKQSEVEGAEDKMETKVSVEPRRKYDGSAPKRKKRKEEVIMDGLHGEVGGFMPSDDELTVDDLISIAKEYVNADKGKELHKAHDVGYGLETQSLVTSISKTGCEKDLTSHPESRIAVKGTGLSATCSVTEPSLFSGSISNPGITADSTRDMLDLFLGPLLKTAEAMERKTDAMTKNNTRP